MLEKERSNLARPRGFGRYLLRFPILLYKAHLGRLLGNRFVLLTHTGRKTGMLHKTVLEVVRYEAMSGVCIVASGWDIRSDWFQNITVNPKVSIQVQDRKSTAIAERLSPDAAGKELLDYSRRHPLAFCELARLMGYPLENPQQDAYALGRVLPMFAFKPISEGI